MAKKRFRDKAGLSPVRKRHAGEKGRDQKELKNGVDSEAIAARNASESPLLRLPREIRDMIWKLAYGGRMLHPSDDGWQWAKPVPAKPWSYHECQLQDPKQYYYFSRQGVSSTDSMQWAAPELNFGNPLVGMDHLSCKWTGLHSEFITSTACKQVWEESQDSFWKTNIFCFRNTWHLQMFLMDAAFQNKVHRITQIYITMDENAKFFGPWEKDILYGPISKLTSLQGLHIVLHCEEGDIFARLPSGKFTSSSISGVPYLPKLVRQFQQFELQPNKTTVFLEIYDSEFDRQSRTFPVQLRLEWAEYIKAALLTHKPLRRSERIAASLGSGA